MQVLDLEVVVVLMLPTMLSVPARLKLLLVVAVVLMPMVETVTWHQRMPLLHISCMQEVENMVTKSLRIKMSAKKHVQHLVDLVVPPVMERLRQMVIREVVDPSEAVTIIQEVAETLQMVAAAALHMTMIEVVMMERLQVEVEVVLV